MYAEATLALPLIAGYALHKGAAEGREGEELDRGAEPYRRTCVRLRASSYIVGRCPNWFTFLSQRRIPRYHEASAMTALPSIVFGLMLLSMFLLGFHTLRQSSRTRDLQRELEQLKEALRRSREYCRAAESEAGAAVRSGHCQR